MYEKEGLEHSEKMATHAVGVFFFFLRLNLAKRNGG